MPEAYVGAVVELFAQRKVRFWVFLSFYHNSKSSRLRVGAAQGVCVWGGGESETRV